MADHAAWNPPRPLAANVKAIETHLTIRPVRIDMETHLVRRPVYGGAPRRPQTERLWRCTLWGGQSQGGRGGKRGEKGRRVQVFGCGGCRPGVNRTPGPPARYRCASISLRPCRAGPPLTGRRTRCISIAFTFAAPRATSHPAAPLTLPKLA